MRNFYIKQVASIIVLGLIGLLPVNSAMAQGGTGLRFDGVNDYVNVPDNSSLDFGGNNFTIETWTRKLGNSTSYQNSGVVGKWNTGALAGTNEWLLQNSSTGNDNKPAFLIEVGATTYQVTGSTTMALNTWYHLAAVRDGANLYLYVNGVLDGTLTIPVNAVVNNAGRDMTLGAFRFNDPANPAIYSNIDMDEFRIWSRALCQAEIQNNKDCELNTAGQTGLVSLYHFNQGIAGGDNRPVTVPGAPIITGVTTASGNATVAFAPPASDGGLPITSYTVTSNPGGISVSGAASPISISGLTNGTSYTFTVIAANSFGSSAASDASSPVTPLSVPGAPTAVTATKSGANSVSVAFTAPANNGGAAISSYTVTSSPDNITASGSGSPITVTGLNLGKTYTFTVVANNSVGAGPSSAASSSVLIPGLPNPPTITSVSGGNQQIVVSFTPPANTGGLPVTSYTVTTTPGNVNATGTSSPITIVGLTNGTSYTITAKTTTSFGTSAASAASASVTPKGPPSAPSNVIASQSGSLGDRASVAFTAPSNNGGSPISSYTVTCSPGGMTASGTGSPIIITGLTAGTTYRFTVHATNAVGSSPESTQSAAFIPTGVPGAPTMLNAVLNADGISATITFNPPASNGGLAITQYKVTSSPGGLTTTGTSSPLTVSNLTPGTSYTFTVVAINSRGTGAASAASQPVTTASGSTNNVVLLVWSGYGVFVDAKTGYVFNASDGSETDAATGELKIPAPATMPAVVQMDAAASFVTYDASTGRYLTYRFTYIDPWEFTEYDRSGNPYATVGSPLWLITSDLKLVDLLDGTSNESQGILHEPATTAVITGAVQAFTPMGTPASFLLSTAPAPAAAVNRKSSPVPASKALPAIGLVNDNPSYIVGPYDYSNASVGDLIELGGNITTAYAGTDPGTTSAAPAGGLTSTTILIDETGNNNGTLVNFALNGSFSNWSVGIASGTCAPFVVPANPITGTTTVCPGSTTILSNTNTGGTWSSSDNTIATVNASGVVTGIAAGNVTITYTNTCGGVSTATIMVGALPTVSAVTGNLTACYGGTTTLAAASSASSPVFNWYSAATNGTLYYTGATYTTGAMTTAGTYYVSVTDGNGCVSATRTPVTVTTTTLPEANAKAVNPTTFCAGGNVGLSAATYALQLNGTNTVFVAKGYAATDDVTYEATINATSFASGDFNVIVNHFNYSTGAIHFQFINGTLQFSVAGNSPNDQYASYTFSPNTTYKVAAVYSKSGKYVKFYVNGVFVNQANYSSAGSIINNAPYYIGSWNGNSRFFRGTLDNIRIWNIQRSAADILDSYNNVPVPAGTSGLIRNYRFDEGTGSTTSDDAGNGVGTLVNNPSWASTTPAGATYLWSPGGATTQNITANASGNYTVQVTNTNGCAVTSDATVVTVNALPTITNVTGTQTFCAGGSTTLTASSTATSPVFKWYTAATNGTLLFTGAAYNTGVLNASATYYVDVTNASGCTSARTAVAVNVNQVPTVSIAKTDVSCSGAGDGMITVTAGGATGPFQYSKDGGTTFQSSNAFASLAPAAYNVIVKTANCTAVAVPVTITTTVDVTPPVPNIMSLPALTGECAVTVSAVPTATDNCSGLITATTTDPLTYTNQGTYTITWKYTDAKGNVSTQTQSVIVKDVTPPVIVCAPDQSATVAAGQCNATVVVTSPTVTDNCSGYSGNNGLDFDGQNDWVDIGNQLTANASYTKEAWIYTKSANASGNIVSADDYPFWLENNLLSASHGFNTGGAGTIRDPNQFPVKQWTHVAVTYDAPTHTMKIYKNGIVVASKTNQLSYTASSLSIGQYKGGNFINAIIDEVRVWNVARTSAEINANMNVAITGSPAGLVSRYSFDQGTVGGLNTGLTTLTNTQGNASYNGTLTNFALSGANSNWVSGAPALSGLVLNNSFNNTSNASGSYPIGTTNVVWTATDAAGNVSTCTQVVTVNAPEINIAGNGTSIINGDINPSATDNTDLGGTTPGTQVTKTFAIQNTGTASLNVSSIGVSGTNASNFTVNGISLPATIAAGGSATFNVVFNATAVGTKTATITVNNTDCDEAAYNFAITAQITCTTPAFTNTNASVTANTAANNCNAVVSYGLNATGTPAPGLSYTFTGATTGTGSGTGSGQAFNSGVTNVTVTATNSCGTVTYPFIVTVTDNIAPTITAPANVVVMNDAGVCGATVTTGTPATADNCGVASVVGVRSDALALTAVYPIGSTTITWTVTDNSGLTATATQTVTVNAPEINLTGNGVSIVKGDATPSVSDNTDMGSTITGTQVSKTFTIQNTGSSPLTVSSIDISGANAADFSIGGISFPVTIAMGGSTNFAVTLNSATAGVKNAIITVSNTDCNEASYDFAVKGQTTCTAPSFANTNFYIQQSTSSTACTAVVNYPLSVSGTPAPGVTYTFTGATTGTGSGTGSGQTFNQGITHVTVSATNACSTVNTTFDVTVVDNVKPTVISKNITIYLDQTGHARFNAADLDGGSYDNCGGPVTIGLNQGTICGTAAEGSSVTLQAPAGVNISGIKFASYGTPNGSCGNFTLGSCNASNSMSIVSGLAIGKNTVTIPATNAQFGDPCNGTVKRLYIEASYGYGGTGNTGDFTCTNLGANTVTYLVSDAAGNVSTGTAIVTVVDRQGPAITAPNVTRAATNPAQCGTNVTFAATATDCTPGTIAYSYSIASGSFFNIGTTPVTVTATDPLGNTSTATFNVIVTDGAGPVITAPADITVDNAAGVCGSTATFAAKAADCSGVSSVTYDKQPGSYMFPVGISTVTITARDILGNVSTATFRVTVNDREVPVITQPVNISVNNDAGKCGAMVNVAAPVASDNCGGILSKTGIRSDALALNALYPVGITTITWTVTDTHNNVSTATQTVTVTDNENPVLVGVPADATVECDAVPAPPAVGATDNCATSVPVMTEIRIDGDCRSSYTLKRTWTTTDASNNVTAATQTITVRDTKAPVLSAAPADATVSCDAVPAPATLTATDNCDAAPTVVFDETRIDGINPSNYKLIRTWTATDACGNRSGKTQTIIVQDVTKPVITVVPQNIEVSNDPTVCGVKVDFSAAATDNCGPVTITYSQAPGSVFAVGSTTVTIRATDVTGNFSEATFTVKVNDTEKPIVKAPGAYSVPSDPGKCGATISSIGEPFTGDNCEVASVTNDHPSKEYPVGTTIVTWIVTDIHGNVTDTAKQSITVIDNELPKITVLNISRNTDADKCGATIVLATPVTSDNCGVATVVNDHPSNLFPKGTTNVTWTVTDIHGLKSQAVQQVVVIDSVAPVITAVPAQVVCANADGTKQYNIPVLNSSDNCAVESTSYAITGKTTRSGAGNNASGEFNEGISLITWTVKDVNGNASTSTTTVTVNTLPKASIAVSSADAFCNKVTLTVSSTINPVSYSWTNTNGYFGGNQTISLDLSNADGVYSVWVTDITTNCTSAIAAAYDYRKENLVSNYTILSFKDTKIGKYNKVKTGSVGVMNSRYGARFDSYSSVSGLGSFVKAADIDKNGNGITLNKEILGVATVTLPTMMYNTANTKDLPNLNASISNVTINGNFKNLTVKKGISVTVTGSIFGIVKLEEGASIRFTSPVLNIETLDADKGSKNNDYSYIRFAPGTSVKVSSKVKIGNQVWVNPENNQVTFYMGDLKSDEEKFTVNGGDTKVTANVYMLNGKLKVHATDDDKDDYDSCNHQAHNAVNCPHKGHGHNDCDHKAHNEKDCGDDVYMTGLFIAESVESHGNTVIWNSFSCGAAPAVLVNNGSKAVDASKSTSEITSPVGEEVLTVTVMPNPSTTYFTLKLSSRNTAPVNLRVMDANGRTVDTRSKLSPNSTLQIGQSYSSGTYYAEFIQGSTRKVVQLIKARG